MVLLCYAFIGQAQSNISEKSDTGKFETKMAEIEKKVNALEFNRGNLKEFFNNGVDTKKTELDAKFNDVKSAVIVLSILALAGILGTCFVYFVELPKKAKQIFTEKMGELLNEEKATIVNLIRDYEVENRLSKEKSILVISSNSENNSKIKDFLKRSLGFKTVSTVLFNDNSIELNEKMKNSNVVFFNNIANSLDSNFMKNVLTEFKDYNTCFVYYGSGFNSELVGFRNINFANSEFTIYARIIETLKIQEVIRIAGKNQ